MHSVRYGRSTTFDVLKQVVLLSCRTTEFAGPHAVDSQWYGFVSNVGLKSNLFDRFSSALPISTTFEKAGFKFSP